MQRKDLELKSSNDSLALWIAKMIEKDCFMLILGRG